MTPDACTSASAFRVDALAVSWSGFCRSHLLFHFFVKASITSIRENKTLKISLNKTSPQQ